MITEKNKEEIEKIGCGEFASICFKKIFQSNRGRLEMITDKNKEEIEKIKKEIERYPIYKDYLEERLKERINTSIQWCEDEIEFLERLLWEDTYVILKGADLIISKKSEIRNHLTWLKEQEEDLK